MIGNYGAHNTEYGLEREDYTRVTSIGDCNGGPCRFVAFTKNGTRLDFGGTPDSTLDSINIDEPIRMWALNKVTDTRGNTLIIKYFDHVGTLYPTRIEYTGNTRLPNATPMRFVEFEYESRNDDEHVWTAGSISALLKRLKSIKTYIHSERASAASVAATATLVKDYRLQYHYSPATGSSRLSKIPGMRRGFTGMQRVFNAISLARQRFCL